MKDRREKLEEYINNIKDFSIYYNGIECNDLKELVQYMKYYLNDNILNEKDIKILKLDNKYSKKLRKNLVNLIEIYLDDSTIEPKDLEKNLG